jgi:hypothetical protein
MCGCVRTMRDAPPVTPAGFSLAFVARCGDPLGLMVWLSFRDSSARLTQRAG